MPRHTSRWASWCAASLNVLSPATVHRGGEGLRAGAAGVGDRVHGEQIEPGGVQLPDTVG